MSVRGFVSPVTDSQSVFRSVMMALARPGTMEALGTLPLPPEPMTAELAAVALALADHETPVWLDTRLAASAAIADYLRFETGAPLCADPAAASFALILDPATCPPLSVFSQGTDDDPDRSTTLVIAVEGLDGGAELSLEGPGLAAPTRFAPRLPAGFAAQLVSNRAQFPRGVDCILVSGGRVAALPRSTRVTER